MKTIVIGIALLGLAAGAAVKQVSADEGKKPLVHASCKILKGGVVKCHTVRREGAGTNFSYHWEYRVKKHPDCDGKTKVFQKYPKDGVEGECR